MSNIKIVINGKQYSEADLRAYANRQSWSQLTPVQKEIPAALAANQDLDIKYVVSVLDNLDKFPGLDLHNWTLKFTKTPNDNADTLGFTSFTKATIELNQNVREVDSEWVIDTKDGSGRIDGSKGTIDVLAHELAHWSCRGLTTNVETKINGKTKIVDRFHNHQGTLTPGFIDKYIGEGLLKKEDVVSEYIFRAVSIDINTKLRGGHVDSSEVGQLLALRKYIEGKAAEEQKAATENGTENKGFFSEVIRRDLLKSNGAELITSAHHGALHDYVRSEFLEKYSDEKAASIKKLIAGQTTFHKAANDVSKLEELSSSLEHSENGPPGQRKEPKSDLENWLGLE